MTETISTKMKYLFAQPAIEYYTWQLEVSIASLLESKVDPGDIHIVSGRQNLVISPGFEKLQQKHPEIVWAFYHDNRSDKQRQYIPSIRPHLIKKHWRQNPWLQDEVIFYMEADTILKKAVPKKYEKTETWYLSNTTSYIGHDYIIDRDPRFLDLFCSIVGVDKELVKNNQKGSGGAQYIMKGLTEQYWEKVEKDCVEIYHQGSKLNQEIKAENPDWHELQIWTACMWAHLWNAWLLGHKTKCPKDLEFAWATDPIDYLDKRWIFHNAGVVEDHNGLMMKSDYINSLPYDKTLEIDQTKAGSWYWAKVQQVGKTSCLK